MKPDNAKQNRRLDKALALLAAPQRSVKSPAQRRLAKILDADTRALIITNRLARAGHALTSIVQIAPLDRLLDRTRRGPRQVR